MIVREILDDPAILDCFDYFNDAIDTLSWLRMIAISNRTTLARAERARTLAQELEQRSKAYFTELAMERNRV